MPGTIVFALFGAVGQSIYHSLDASHTAKVNRDASTLPTEPTSFLQRIAEKKWIPVKALTDAEYENLLREKLLRVDAELAILDEDIAKVMREQDSESSKSEKT